MDFHYTMVLRQAQELQRLGLRVPEGQVLELARKARGLRPMNDRSMQVALVIPQRIIPLSEQIARVRLKMRKSEAADNAGRRQQIDQLMAKGSLTRREQDTLNRLRQEEQNALLIWREAPRDRVGYMASTWPHRLFSCVHDVPQDRPYLIHEIDPAEHGYQCDEEGEKPRGMPEVCRSLATQHRRGLTLAEGIALSILRPEWFEEEYHVDLLGSDMQVMNTTNGVVFMRRAADQVLGRPGFTYLSTRTVITTV